MEVCLQLYNENKRPLKLVRYIIIMYVSYVQNIYCLGPFTNTEICMAAILGHKFKSKEAQVDTVVV